MLITYEKSVPNINKYLKPLYCIMQFVENSYALWLCGTVSDRKTTCHVHTLSYSTVCTSKTLPTYSICRSLNKHVYTLLPLCIVGVGGEGQRERESG